jgi:hypothetical protein
MPDTRSGSRPIPPPLVAVCAERYDLRMASRQIESRPERTPVLRKAVAGLVLLAVAALVIHVVAHLVLFVLWTVLVIAGIVAVLWALNTIL